MGEARKTRKYGQLSDERDPRYKSSKDTKRWCRGRIGIEHRKMWSDQADKFRTRFNLPYYEVLSCLECGKEFERTVKQWSIPTLIQAVRIALGLTQDELGKLAGMPQSRIAFIETGSGDVTVNTLKKLAKALNISLDVDFHDCGRIGLNRASHEQI